MRYGVAVAVTVNVGSAVSVLVDAGSVEIGSAVAVAMASPVIKICQAISKSPERVWTLEKSVSSSTNVR